MLGRSADIDEQTRAEILAAVRGLRRDMGSAEDQELEVWISSVVRCMGESNVEYGSGLGQASAENLRRCLDGITH